MGNATKARVTIAGRPSDATGLHRGCRLIVVPLLAVRPPSYSAPTQATACEFIYASPSGLSTFRSLRPGQRPGGRRRQVFWPGRLPPLPEPGFRPGRRMSGIWAKKTRLVRCLLRRLLEELPHTLLDLRRREVLFAR